MWIQVLKLASTLVMGVAAGFVIYAMNRRQEETPQQNRGPRNPPDVVPPSFSTQERRRCGARARRSPQRECIVCYEPLPLNSVVWQCSICYLIMDCNCTNKWANERSPISHFTCPLCKTVYTPEKLTSTFAYYTNDLS